MKEKFSLSLTSPCPLSTLRHISQAHTQVVLVGQAHKEANHYWSARFAICEMLLFLRPYFCLMKSTVGTRFFIELTRRTRSPLSISNFDPSTTPMYVSATVCVSTLK